jgi:serine/threonine protein phosphatase PrpC
MKQWTFAKKITPLFSRWKKQQRDERERPYTVTLVQYDVEAHMHTDVGCYREANEDCIRYVKPGDPELLARKGILAIVADGMGGHSAGEVASKLVVDVIMRVYYQHTDKPHIALKRALEEANRIVYETALNDERLQGMGTTCTALVLKNEMAFVAHVGDSRLYLLRDGELSLMTEDHTIVRRMVQAGLITLRDARFHPAKNILVRAIGTRPEVDISMWEHPFPIQLEDRFILCSDGLHDLVEDTEIKQVLLSQPSSTSCSSLIALARERGGYDNITVGLLEVRPANGRTVKSAPETRGA